MVFVVRDWSSAPNSRVRELRTQIYKFRAFQLVGRLLQFLQPERLWHQSTLLTSILPSASLCSLYISYLRANIENASEKKARASNVWTVWHTVYGKWRLLLKSFMHSRFVFAIRLVSFWRIYDKSWGHYTRKFASSMRPDISSFRITKRESALSRERNERRERYCTHLMWRVC